MTTKWTDDVTKTFPLALLGLAGAYYAYQAFNKPQVTSTESSLKPTNPPSVSAESTPPQDPQIFFDGVTGEYLILEDGSDEPRPITVEEIFELTGSRPIQEDEATAVVPESESAAPVLPPTPAPAENEAVVPAPATATQQADHVEQTEAAVVAPNEQVEELIPVAEPLAPVGGVIGLEDFEDLAEEQIDIELERANQALPPVEQDMTGGAGGPGPATTANNNRIVGAKKTKSMERKDQRRAYSEHVRMQALVDKQDEEEFQKQYRDEIEAEREERRLIEEEAIRERKETQRKQREEEEALKREKEKTRQEIDSLEPGAVKKLETELEKESAQIVVASSNLSSISPLFVVEEGNWAVRLSEGDVGELAASIKGAGNGIMTFEALADTLTAIKQQQA